MSRRSEIIDQLPLSRNFGSRAEWLLKYGASVQSFSLRVIARRRVPTCRGRRVLLRSMIRSAAALSGGPGSGSCRPAALGAFRQVGLRNRVAKGTSTGTMASGRVTQNAAVTPVHLFCNADARSACATSLDRGWAPTRIPLSTASSSSSTSSGGNAPPSTAWNTEPPEASSWRVGVGTIWTRVSAFDAGPPQRSILP